MRHKKSFTVFIGLSPLPLLPERCIHGALFAMDMSMKILQEMSVQTSGQLLYSYLEIY